MIDTPLITWSIALIAERDGVSRQAVSKQIRKISELQPDTPLELDGRGRIVGVSIAHYDEHRERFLNPAKIAATVLKSRVGRPATAAPSTDSFEEARRQSEWIKVSREKIRHQQEIGQLVRTDKLREATHIVGNEIRAICARLPNRADELALAISREGISGARIALRKIAFELNTEIADKVSQISMSAPESDPLIDNDSHESNPKE